MFLKVWKGENRMKDNKDFLGTEPVGKLLMKLALPTVAAQIINMLYNIVDRIYIGHIKDVGALALTGVGVCMPLIMIVAAFAALISNGGAPRATIFMGKGDKESAEKTLGNCFSLQIVISLLLTTILLVFNGIWRKQKHNRVWCKLHEHLCHWYDFRTVDIGNECLYYCTGICKNRNAFRFNRSNFQYYIRPDFYFRIGFRG